MQWKGPFTVLSEIGESSYSIDVNGKSKSFHANLLKEYISRDKSNVVGTTVISMSEDEEQESCFELPALQTNQSESASDVVVNDELGVGQSHEVKRVLSKFTDVLTDVPGKTDVLKCDIKLTTDKPIKAKPYPVPLSMRDSLQEEVRKMIDMGVIEPSNSPYSSPVVLVPKPDGTKRFCVDYRKLNKVTTYEAEPMQTMTEIFSELSNDKYFSRIDLTKGYWQVEMTQSAKRRLPL
ncbi:hypothetical protein BSL78_06231 [Apostichopus japonicus]|nr:hypothetical protein BSL78_06231 [Apostichopus japonicus]